MRAARNGEDAMRHKHGKLCPTGVQDALPVRVMSDVAD